jgi:Flp pilus assembly protein TadD
VPEDHELAGIWNDPEFTKRLLGSYGFAPDLEPRLDPEEYMAYTNRVVPYLGEDQPRAMRELEALIQPDSSAVFEYTLGNLYFQEGNFTNAVKYFDQATAKWPSYRRAWQSMGFALARDGQYDEAVAPLARAIALGGADSKAYGLLGFSFMNARRYVSAEAAYRQAMLLEPDNVDYKLGIVKCQVAQQDYTAALALLDELIEDQPDREQYWTLQANVLLQIGQSAKAAVNLEMLRRMDKARPESLALLGDIYMTQEANELALEAYRAAIQQDDGNNLKRSLRAADIMVSRGAWEEALALFAAIRATAGDRLQGEDEMKLLKLESKVAMASGTGEDAIRTLELIVEKNPLDGEALLLAGDYYARSGDKERARIRYDSASKVEGHEADALVKLAQLQVQSGKYADAMDLLRKAQKVRPRDNVQRYLEAIERMARSAAS